MSVIVPKGNDIRLCVEIRSAIKAVIRVKHPSLTIDDILISLQAYTSFSKLGLKSELHQLESSLAFHSITIFQTEKRKYVIRHLLLGYILPRRSYIMPSVKFLWAWRELKILHMIFFPILRKDFIVIRLEWYYIKPQEVFIF